MTYEQFIINVFGSTELLCSAELEQKNVLIVRESYSEESLRNLFYGAYGDNFDLSFSRLRQMDCIKLPGEFDCVFLLDGLETVKSFPAAVANIKAACKKNGMIFIIARTPDDDGREMNFYHYEDYWHYSIEDLQMLFADCLCVSTVMDDECPYIAVKFVKAEIFQQIDVQTIPIFNCRWHKKMLFGKDAFAAGYFGADKRLDDLGVKYKTDKSSMEHHYLDKYDFFLQRFCGREFIFMELGVFEGASIKMWKEYFPAAKIIGVDINPACQQFIEERVCIITADLSREENLQQLGRMKASIIIDDASHLWSHQLLALITLFPTLPSGGIYILEDLATSLNPGKWPGYDDAPLSGYDLCSQIAEVVTGKTQLRFPGIYKEKIEEIGRETELISFIRGSCILIKR